MKTSKIICLILAVVMMISVLGGCSGAALVNPVSDGEFVYTIVRSADSGTAEQNAVRELRAAIKSNFDCNVTVAKDSVAENNDESYEILVGNTDREASAIAKEALMNNRVNNSKDFIVKVVGNKIAIYAPNDEMIEVAAQWFIQTFCGSTDDFKQLHSNYEFIYAHESASSSDHINKVNNVDVGRYKVVLPRQTLYLVGRQLELYAEYMDQFGYSIIFGDERDAEEEYEILVGDTTRAASKSVNVEGNNYVIKVVGNKIVIKGGNDLATHRAAIEFYNLVLESESADKAFSWSDGYTINGKYDESENGAYTLNFNEDFDGSVVDINKWSSYRYVDKTIGESCLGGKQYSVDWKGNCDIPEGRNLNLIYQSDGKLHLGTKILNDKDFAMSDVTTVDTMVYRYGFIEVKMKLPHNPAYGGIWLNGSTNNSSRQIKRFGGLMNHSAMTEIDILENFSDEHSFHSNVHHWYNVYKGDGISAYGNGHNSIDGDARYNGKSLNNKKYSFDSVKNNGTLADDFHIYSCYWDDTTIDFAFDGRRFLHYDLAEQEMPSVSCELVYLILDTGMGSASYGATYNRNRHEKFYETEVDYVKIYQSNKVNSQMVYAWPMDQEKGTLKFVYPDVDVNGKY